MIATSELESAIRAAIPVSHLEIIDQSNGCGENYAIIVVSEVRPLTGLERCRRHLELIFVSSLARHSRARQPWPDTATVIRALSLDDPWATVLIFATSQ